MSTTLKEIRDNIKNDLDLHEEDWKDDSDLNVMINKAVKDAHRKVITIHEDYFLTNKQYDLAADDSYISYPSDIHLNKIKSMFIYVNNTALEIKPARRFDSVVMYNQAISGDGGISRKYLPVDSADEGRRLKLFPDNGDAGTVDLWYIREAKKLVNDDDVCDIDEFGDYIEAWVRAKYYKLDGDPRHADERNTREELRRDMVNSLTNMNEGNDDEILADYSHYQDSV